MRIITHQCSDCGTIVAANVLESNRRMKCPRIGCDAILSFEDLSERERQHLLENAERYQL